MRGRRHISTKYTKHTLFAYFYICIVCKGMFAYVKQFEHVN